MASTIKYLLLIPSLSTAFRQMSKHSHPYITMSQAPLGLDDIANRYKVTQFGQGTSAFYGLECLDRQYYCKDFSVRVNLSGGLGLDLIEVFANRDGISGLVMVEDIQSGSNAAKTEFFRPGDTFVSISSDQQNFASLEGLNFDRTADILRKYKEEESAILKVICRSYD